SGAPAAATGGLPSAVAPKAAPARLRVKLRRFIFSPPELRTTAFFETPMLHIRGRDARTFRPLGCSAALYCNAPATALERSEGACPERSEGASRAFSALTTAPPAEKLAFMRGGNNTMAVVIFSERSRICLICLHCLNWMCYS